ncbi:MAG: thiamine pyrophosphate-binding protein, partial [Anaerolineales bacterium]
MTLTMSDVVAQTLREEGVEVIFGLPGGENVPLVAAIDRAGIRFVLMRHESRAVWAADAYARIGRRVGVCLSTLGPGAVNLAAGLAHAYLDRSPMVAITAQLPDYLLAIHSHQRLNLQQVFSPVTKASLVLDGESDPGELVHRAFSTANQGRPGPVHLQISSPFSLEPATLTVQASREIKAKFAHPEIAIASDESITSDGFAKTMDMLRHAKRPAVLMGLALEPTAPYRLVQALVEILQAAAIVTPKAKGAFPENHPLYAGVIGLERQEPAADTLRKADLILGVGFDPVELMVPWSFEAPFIYVGSAPNEDPEIKAQAQLVGDLRQILSRLLGALHTEPGAQRDNWHSQFYPYRQAVNPGVSESPVLLPSQVVRAARELLPEEGIATVDVGAHKLLISKLWDARCPNRFLLSNGISTMGYALPAALGAKLACPDLPVVCFTGDGGMGMVCSALETAVRECLPVVVVVLADEAMSLIRLKQLATGNKLIGTLIGPTDWVKV